MICSPKAGTIHQVRPELVRVVDPDWLIGIRLGLSGGIVGGSSETPVAHDKSAAGREPN